MVAEGPGLEKSGVTTGKWAEFTVDTKHAGKAPISITCIDADYKPVEVQVKDNRDGTYSCRYMPNRNVKHTVSVTFGGVAVPNSPFRVSGCGTGMGAVLLLCLVSLLIPVIIMDGCAVLL